MVIHTLIGYRFLEHTADIKVEAWGDSLENAFRAAGIAFYDIILNIGSVEARIKHEFTVDGFDLMSLLFNYIEYLILAFELDSLVFKDFNIEIKKTGEEYKLDAVGYGELYNKDKHGYKVHVKAMTYHEMEILKKTENSDSRYLIRYIVDI